MIKTITNTTFGEIFLANIDGSFEAKLISKSNTKKLIKDLKSVFNDSEIKQSYGNEKLKALKNAFVQTRNQIDIAKDYKSRYKPLLKTSDKYFYTVTALESLNLLQSNKEKKRTSFSGFNKGQGKNQYIESDTNILISEDKYLGYFNKEKNKPGFIWITNNSDLWHDKKVDSIVEKLGLIHLIRDPAKLVILKIPKQLVQNIHRPLIPHAGDNMRFKQVKFDDFTKKPQKSWGKTQSLNDLLSNQKNINGCFEAVCESIKLSEEHPIEYKIIGKPKKNKLMFDIQSDKCFLSKIQNNMNQDVIIKSIESVIGEKL